MHKKREAVPKKYVGKDVEIRKFSSKAVATQQTYKEYTLQCESKRERERDERNEPYRFIFICFVCTSFGIERMEETDRTGS